MPIPSDMEVEVGTSSSLPSVPQLSIQEIFDEARAHQPDFYDPSDKAVDRLMGTIYAIISKYQTDWRTAELLASFLDNTVKALSSPTATTIVIANIHSYESPPRRDLYARMIQQVIDRLQLAHAALFADDPQLAMSILLNRTCSGSEIEHQADPNIPINDIMEVGETSQPHDQFILIDSAYYRDRFAINPAQLTDLVHQAYVDMKTRPEGFFQSIPQDVLLGKSNHEVRQKHLADYMAATSRAIAIFATQGHSLGNQLKAWTEVRTKWELRAEKHDYQSSLLPPPALPDTVLFYQQIDPYEAIEQIRVQQEVLMIQLEQQDRIAALDENGPYDGRYNRHDQALQTSYEHFYSLMGAELDTAPGEVQVIPYGHLNLLNDCVFRGEIPGHDTE